MENRFTNIIHRQGFLMLFGKTKGIKIFPHSLGQKKKKVIKFYETTLTKEIKLTKLVESNCNVYKKNHV